jgi:hypothetical protein
MELLSSAALVSLATATIWAGARRAYHHPDKPSGVDSLAENEVQTLTLRQAALFPLVGSAVLLFLYLFFKYLEWAIVAYICAIAVGSLTFALQPLVAALVPSRSSAAPRAAPLSAAAGVLVVVVWVLSGHWLLNNVIGVGLCITIISALRLPSLRVAALALVGLLVYDVVWVFASPAVFKESVMVAVAKQEASNPASSVVAALPQAVQEALPREWLPAPKLSMPNKLAVPVWLLVDTDALPLLSSYGGEGTAGQEEGAAVAAAGDGQAAPGDTNDGASSVLWLTPTIALVFAGMTFLGLGDIALPGLLLAFAHRVDIDTSVAAERRAQQQQQQSGEGRAGGAETGGVEVAALRKDGLGAAAHAEEETVAIRMVGAPSTSPAAGSGSSVGGVNSDLTQRRPPSPLAFASSVPSSLALPQRDDGDDGRSPRRQRLLPCRAPALCGRLWRLCAAVRSEVVATLSTRSYFRTALLGYVAGLVLAVACSRLFHAAQPALLYLVPCTLAPLCMHARAHGQLAVFWKGPASLERTVGGGAAPAV